MWVFFGVSNSILQSKKVFVSFSGGSVSKVRVRHSYQDIVEACCKGLWPYWPGLGGWMVNVAQVNTFLILLQYKMTQLWKKNIKGSLQSDQFLLFYYLCKEYKLIVFFKQHNTNVGRFVFQPNSDVKDWWSECQEIWKLGMETKVIPSNIDFWNLKLKHY